MRRRIEKAAAAAAAAAAEETGLRLDGSPAKMAIKWHWIEAKDLFLEPNDAEHMLKSLLHLPGDVPLSFCDIDATKEEQGRGQMEQDYMGSFTRRVEGEFSRSDVEREIARRKEARKAAVEIGSAAVLVISFSFSF